MDVQSAFEHFRKESALIGKEIHRLLAPKSEGSLSEEEGLRRQQELQALLTRQNEAACMLLALKGREMPRTLAKEIAQGGADAVAPTGMSADDELAASKTSLDSFVDAAIIEEPKPVVLDEQSIAVESSPWQEVKAQQQEITGAPETTEEGTTTVPVIDEPAIASEIRHPQQETDLQKQRLDYDWSSLADRCTEPMLPDSHLLENLSEAFNARLGIGELGFSSDEAFSFMEQAFPKLDYEFRFTDLGWVVTCINHVCRSQDSLALAIYGAVCLMLGSQRTDIEEGAGDPADVARCRPL
jgi:hypothetical protein